MNFPRIQPGPLMWKASVSSHEALYSQFKHVTLPNYSSSSKQVKDSYKTVIQEYRLKHINHGNLTGRTNGQELHLRLRKTLDKVAKRKPLIIALVFDLWQERLQPALPEITTAQEEALIQFTQKILSLKSTRNVIAATFLSPACINITFHNDQSHLKCLWAFKHNKALKNFVLFTGCHTVTPVFIYTVIHILICTFCEYMYEESALYTKHLITQAKNCHSYTDI